MNVRMSLVVPPASYRYSDVSNVSLEPHPTDYCDNGPDLKPPVHMPPSQMVINEEDTTQEHNVDIIYNKSMLQPLVDENRSQNVGYESESASTMHSRCKPIEPLCVDENLCEDLPYVKVDNSNNEPAVKCDFEFNEVDGNSTDSSSVSVKTEELKVEPTPYADQLKSLVKSSMPEEVEESLESQEVVAPVNPPTTLTSPAKITKDGMFACTSCRKCFREEKRLQWHMKSHDTRFVDKKKIEVGYISEDDEPLSIRLQRHNAVRKASQDFPCQQCTLTFKREIDCRRHRKQLHTGTETVKFLCPHCPKVYKKRRALLRHEVCHTGGTFKCKRCDNNNIFKVFKEYQHHVRTIHWAKFNCEHCGDTFQSRCKLANHITTYHSSGGKNLPCEKCGKLFQHNVNLKKHLKSQCGESPLFVCKTCGKSYLSQGGFDSHQLSHTGMRVFLCKYCGCNFQHKSVLLIHELKHTGEKPFVCGVCSKAFAHQISLTTHSSVHTGIKPYKCEGCGKGFSCFGNLKKHRLAHMNTCSSTRIRKSKNCEGSNLTN